MKLSGIGTTKGAGQARRTGKTDKSSSGAFARELAGAFGEVDEAQAVDTPAAVGSIDALLATQSVGDALEQNSRQRMVRRGEDILDQLEEIRHGLLMGEIPKEKLQALGDMVRSRRDTVNDPRLAAVLDEIELRAEVELAKLSRSDG